jgi:hypothetical protein
MSLEAHFAPAILVVPGVQLDGIALVLDVCWHRLRASAAAC